MIIVIVIVFICYNIFIKKEIEISKKDKKMNKNLVKIALSTATILLLNACSGGGGGGGGGNTPTSSQSLSGNVIDPAVKNASVELVCGSNIYNASSKTDSNGKFTINEIPATQDLSSCILEAEGGVDGADDLTGLTMKAPYKMFGKNSGLYVTPFTTAVAEHDDVNNDLNASLHVVANFFGTDVDVEDLTKDPTSNIKLAKITKKITKLALSKKSSGELVGYIDIDGNGNGFTNLSDYTLNNTDTNATIKADLQEELKAIEDADSIDAIMKSGIIVNGIKQLESAYKEDVYSDNAKANFKAIATLISNQLTTTTSGETTYGVINRYHIRKALSDLEITPSFEDNNTLKSDIATKINQEDLNTSAIDVSAITGMVLFDSTTYETVVGDDNDKRIAYYTFSDKSNIAKLLEVSENAYTDSVLDSINANIALGVAKLGFIDEAFENIEDNVYTPDAKEKAYQALASLLLEIESNEKSADANYKRYEIVKSQIEALGIENSSKIQEASIQGIAQRIALLEESSRATEVVEYLEELATPSKGASVYARIPIALSDMATNIYIQTVDIDKSIPFVSKSIDIIKGMPNDSQSSLVYSTLRVAILAALFNQNEDAKELSLNAISFDTDEKYTGYGKAYSYYPVAVEALVGEVDINTTITKFKALKPNRQDDASKYGYASALLLNDRADELFNNVYKNADIYSSTAQDYIFRDETNLGVGSTFQTASILKMRAESSLIITWLDRLYEMSKEYNLSSSSDMVKVFAQWDESDTKKYGYLAMAKMYLDLGETAKAENLIEKSIEKMEGLSDLKYKINGYINILNAREEIGLDRDATQTAAIIASLKAAALNENFTDSEALLTAANVFSSNGAQSEAIPMIEKAYAALTAQVDGAIDVIEDRIEILVADNDEDVNLANSYLQAGDLVKANEMIDEAYENIMTLADTVDRYALLVNIARAKASLNSTDGLDALLTEIKTPTENNLAKVAIAEALANYDAFPLTNAASVDSDADGKPDFWNKNATPEEISASGLTLDDDIDGDGTYDDTDTLPYDNIN